MESYDQALIKASERICHPNNTNLDQASELETELHRIWEETLATWPYFND
jgi:hypothetical protein